MTQYALRLAANHKGRAVDLVWTLDVEDEENASFDDIDTIRADMLAEHGDDDDGIELIEAMFSLIEVTFRQKKIEEKK
jgi:hypothetical protein